MTIQPLQSLTIIKLQTTKGFTLLDFILSFISNYLPAITIIAVPIITLNKSSVVRGYFTSLAIVIMILLLDKIGLKIV